MRDARHNQLLAIPAALYAVNNYLKFAMQLYFKPTTAKMLGNLKVPRLAPPSGPPLSFQAVPCIPLFAPMFGCATVAECLGHLGCLRQVKGLTARLSATARRKKR